MSRFPSASSRRAVRSLVILALAVGLFAAVAAYATPWTSASPAPQSGAARLEGELVTIRPEGFLPAEIKRPAGPFILAVYNRSGLIDASFRIDGPGGSTVADVHLPSDQIAWERVLDLPPGTYTVTEPTRGWSCQLTIAD